MTKRIVGNRVFVRHPDYPVPVEILPYIEPKDTGWLRTFLKGEGHSRSMKNMMQNAAPKAAA